MVMTTLNMDNNICKKKKNIHAYKSTHTDLRTLKKNFKLNNLLQTNKKMKNANKLSQTCCLAQSKHWE